MSLGAYDLSRSDIDELLHCEPSNVAALEMKETIARLKSQEMGDISSSPDLNSCDEMEVDRLRKQALGYLSNGKSSLAVDSLNKALDLATFEDESMFSSLLLLLGKAHTGMGQDNDAIAVYEKLIKRIPKNFKAYLRRGEVHLRLVQKNLIFFNSII